MQDDETVVDFPEQKQIHITMEDHSTHSKKSNFFGDSPTSFRKTQEIESRKPKLQLNDDSMQTKEAASMQDSERNSKRHKPVNADFSNVYHPIKSDPSEDTIVESKIVLRNKADMNDVFVPIKSTQEEIYCVLYMQSSVPRIKKYLYFIREKKTEQMNLPFFLGIQELLKGMILFILNESDNFQDPMLIDGEPLKSRQ